MADAQANLNVNLNTSQALASIRALQAEVSRFHQSMTALNGKMANQAATMQRELISGINATGKFSARMTTVASTTDAFTNALEKNKFSMGEYFRYAGASTKTFGRLFKSEFETINRVARERVKTLQTQYIKMGRDANGAMRAISVRPLALDLQDLGTQTAIAAQKQQLFNQLLRQGSTNLLNWGKNTQWAGRQLMVGFTIPLTIFGSVAARTFTDLEEQAIRFKRVYGEMFTTQAETDQMFEQLKALGQEFTKYGVALKDTMAMAADAAAMGKMGVDLLAQVEQAAKLAILGGVDQQQALDTTISLTNTFGTSVEALTDKINFLNAVENQTVVSIEDLTTAIPKAGPVVKQLGGDVEDLAFFLTAMKEGGINASEGANALKSGLASLINPTKQATDMLEGFGININEIVESNKGDIKATVIEFAQALDQLDPLNRARAIEQLFGKFQFARLSTLFTNVIAEGNQASRVLDLTAASTQELAILSERELKRLEDSPLYKFRKAWEDLKVELAPVGEAFMKAVAPIIEFGTTLLKKFNEMGEGGKNFVLGLIAVLGVIAPTLLMTVGLVANGIANLMKLYDAIKRVGTGSTYMKDLGISTEYMTQQQLEAAAVASSLNQSHATLRQTFTSEAVAVNELTIAYQNAVAAQRAFLVGGGGARGARGGKAPSSPAPEKLASGILSVPGPKGAGDIVPAMLSPGEAVIPAKQAQKYGGFIRGIISDNIPGFKSGKYSYTGNETLEQHLTRLRGKDLATAELARANAAAEATYKELRKMSKEQVSVSDNQLKAAKQIDRSHIVQTSGMKNVPGARDSMWGAGTWVARTSAENNMITNAMKTSPRNQKLFEQYLKQTGADKKQVTEILKRTNAGIALTQEQASVQGKALRAIGKDWSAGNIAKGQISPQFGMWARAVGAGQAAVDRLSAKQPANLRQEWTETERKAAQKRIDAYREETKVVKQSTKARSNNTEETKKSTKQTTQLRQSTIVGNVKTTIDKGGRPRYFDAQTGKRLTAADAKAAMAAQPAAAARGGFPVAGIGMAAMAGGMVAPMLPGRAGEIGGQISGALMSGGMLLSMWPMISKAIMSPLGAMGVAIAGIVASILVWNSRIKESTKRGAELAESMGMTTKSVQTLSEFTGTVSATELRQKRAEQQLSGRTPFTAEQLAFGQSFMETDQGKQMVDLVNRLQEQGRTSLEIGSTIARNLTTAMLQGVLTEDQARGIVQALGQELDDYSIPISITGKLTELVGPNGEQLSRDPFSLAVKIQKDAINEQAEIFGSTLAMVSSNKITDFYKSKQAMWFGLGGAVAGGIIGGVVSAGAGAGVGAAAVGAAGFNLGAALAMEERNTELRSMAVNLGYDALELGQQQLDSIELQYTQQLAVVDEKINQATTEEEINRLMAERQAITDKYITTQGIILDQNQQIIDGLVEQARLLGNEKFFGITKESALAMFPGLEALIGPAVDQALQMANTKPEQIVQPDIPWWQRAEAAQSPVPLPTEFNPFRPNQNIQGSDIYRMALMQDREDQRAAEQRKFAVQITADFMAGNIPPMVFNNLIEAGQEDQTIVRKYNILAKEVGGAKTGQLINLLEAYGQGPGAEDKTAFNLVMDFASKNTEEIDKVTSAVAMLASVDSAYGFTVDFSDEGTVERIDQIMEQMDTLSEYPETIDVATIIEDANNEASAGYEIFNDLLTAYGDLGDLDNISKQFIIDFLVNVTNPDLVNQYLNAVGDVGSGSSVVADYAAGLSNKSALVPSIQDISGASTKKSGATDGTTPDDSGGGGKQTSWLDPIVRASRNFGNAGQELTQGWEASLDAILKMVDGVAWATNGLGNQLRSINVPETLIEKFLGMEPEEWEKTKKELFDDIDGKLQLNEKGKQVMKAYGSSVIAEKRGDIESETQSTLNQVEAFDKLRRSGMSASEAFSIIQDKKVADAIATSNNTEEVKKLIAAQRELTKAQEEYQEISEQQRISDAVREINKDFKEQSQIVSKLSQAGSRYTEAQINAILNNKDIGKLFLKPNIDKKALEQALANANKQADLELKIKKLTLVGQEDIFQTGISNAMDAFNAKQREIELDFKVKVADDTALVDSAQQQIAKIDFQLDDYQAALQEIDWAEQKINDSYEKRFEALDRVKEVNDQIAASQQKQLDLADALSRGDIAAAAKAAQEMRAQQQEDAIATQRRMMETAQQTELARIRSSAGMTRQQLEDKILELEKQRFGIEENTLEPAQERIRLAEIQRDAQITDLEVLGKTRDEWERIANQVDVARANGYRFADAMKEALGIMETLIDNLLNRPKPPPPPEPPKSSGGNNYKWEGEMAGPAGRAARKEAREQVANRKAIRAGQTPPYPSAGGYSMGGMVKGYSFGGMVARYAAGGYSMGSDTIPAMLTPGEFVVRRPAVNAFGKDNLEKINRGTYDGNEVYNYNLNVNVNSDADPNEIANTVMRSIKQVEGRRIRGNSYNG